MYPARAFTSTKGVTLFSLLVTINSEEGYDFTPSKGKELLVHRLERLPATILDNHLINSNH